MRTQGTLIAKKRTKVLLFCNIHKSFCKKSHFSCSFSANYVQTGHRYPTLHILYHATPIPIAQSPSPCHHQTSNILSDISHPARHRHSTNLSQFCREPVASVSRVRRGSFEQMTQTRRWTFNILSRATKIIQNRPESKFFRIIFAFSS